MLNLTACQHHFGYYYDLHCKSCFMNGAGLCDPDGCPVGSVFVRTEKRCAGWNEYKGFRVEQHILLNF